MKVPEKGFYYHFKHDPAGPIHNYAYEVIGIALDTETMKYSVVYRPLYKDSFFDGSDFCVRPVEMFSEMVQKDGTAAPRFAKIIDAVAIAELKKMQ